MLDRAYNLILDMLNIENDLAVGVKVVEGVSVPEEILITALIEKADMIVMGTHGENFINKAIFGTNASNTAFKSSLPVLLIPQHCHYCPVDKLICATDMHYLTDEITALLPIANSLNIPVDILYLGYGWDKDERMEEFARLALNTSYNDITFIYEKISPEQPIADHLQHLVEKNEGQLLAIFPGERTVIDKLLLNSKTETLCYQIDIPMLVIRKQVLVNAVLNTPTRQLFSREKQITR